MRSAMPAKKPADRKAYREGSPLDCVVHMMPLADYGLTEARPMIPAPRMAFDTVR